MAKGARESNKAQRSERQAKQLTRLTEVIGVLWQGRPECMEAAALFVATAERLRIPVEARAVSILAIDIETHSIAATGLAASEDAKARLQVTPVGTPDDADSSFERAGHMVVTSSALSMLFDPTFGQFALDGLPDLAISAKIADPHPTSKRLTLEAGKGGIEITYFFDDANTGWQKETAWAAKQWSAVADELASHIGSGGTAADLPFAIPWEEQPDR